MFPPRIRTCTRRIPSAAIRHRRRSGSRAGLRLTAVLAAALSMSLVACDRRPGTGRAGAPNPELTAAYPEIVAEAVRERRRLEKEWRAARTPADREQVLDRAAVALGRIVIDRILPSWNGTPWSFSGTAERPGRGSIACGYLVSTALEHAGLRVERRRLAQQAAEDIVLTLAPPERVVRFRRAPFELFLAAVARGGDGLYVVGLDYHVGFLVVDRGVVWFHHASNVAGGVLREPALLSIALVTSNYRVVGKLFDRELAHAWLAQSAVITHTRIR